MEIDGNSGTEVPGEDGSKNTINGQDQKSWSLKDPLPVFSRGSKARSGAKLTKKVGVTKKTDKEIKEFNARYLAKHPTYSLTKRNCQDYVYELVEWLVGKVDNLPMKEVKKVALGAAAVGGLALLGGALWRWSGQGKETKNEKKETQDVSDEEQKTTNMVA